MFMVCTDCPRHCKVDKKSKAGFCGARDKIVVAKVIENFMWEEPCITGKKGTLAIFFSGCNLRCSYCQNYKISNSFQGLKFSPKQFSDYLKKYDLKKYSSIELITPTHFTNLLIEAFKGFKCPIPVVWNSGGYENSENLKKVSLFVDIFLPDFKYGDDEIAKKFSAVENYSSISLNAIKEMSLLKKNKFRKGIMVQGVLIRHLILPGYLENSFKVLQLIKENIKEPYISIMGQFTPVNNTITRKLLPLEYKIVMRYAEKLGLKRGYTQELSSASQGYIPRF